MTPANIATLVRFLTKTNTTSFTDAQILLLANQSYERKAGNILAETSGGRWKWGDLSYTAFPTYTKDLVADQQQYEIDFHATDNLQNPLVILGVEVRDQDGNYYPLKTITLEDIHALGVAQDRYRPDSGRPAEYEKREHMVVLYPAPDNGVSVTLSAGLRIFFLRGANILANVTATDRQIGLPSPWQDSIAWEVSYNYAVANGLPNANQLKAEMLEKDRELMRFISKRGQDDRPITSIRVEPYF